MVEAVVEGLILTHMFVSVPTQTPSKKKLEVSAIASNYHIEINPRSVHL